MAMSPDVGGTTTRPARISPANAQQKWAQAGCNTVLFDWQLFNELIANIRNACTEVGVTISPNSDYHLKDCFNKTLHGRLAAEFGVVQAYKIEATAGDGQDGRIKGTYFEALDSIKTSSFKGVSATNISATNISATGNFTGNLVGNTNGTHNGPSSGTHTGNTIGTHSGNVQNATQISGDNINASNGFFGNLVGNSQGTHTGNVNGDLDGNTTGVHTGPINLNNEKLKFGPDSQNDYLRRNTSNGQFEFARSGSTNSSEVRLGKLYLGSSNTNEMPYTPVRRVTFTPNANWANNSAEKIGIAEYDEGWLWFRIQIKLQAGQGLTGSAWAIIDNLPEKDRIIKSPHQTAFVRVTSDYYFEENQAGCTYAIFGDFEKSNSLHFMMQQEVTDDKITKSGIQNHMSTNSLHNNGSWLLCEGNFMLDTG